MTDFIRRPIALAGASTSGLQAGSGPLIHFAHATGFNAQTYATLLAPLTQGYRVTAADARGHGLSDLPVGPSLAAGWATGWRMFAADLAAVLEALGGGPALLAGHSMGATVSLMVAAKRPDLVAGLVLIEPVFIPPHLRVLSALRKRLARGGGGMDLAARAAKRRALYPSIEAMIASYRGRGAFRVWPDAMLEDYVRGGTRPAEGGQVRLSCAPSVEADVFTHGPAAAERHARHTRCPITLLHGDQPGTTCRPRSLANFRRLRPDARIVTVAGAGHFLPMQRPDLVREEIAALGERVFPR